MLFHPNPQKSMYVTNEKKGCPFNFYADLVLWVSNIQRLPENHYFYGDVGFNIGFICVILKIIQISLYLKKWILRFFFLNSSLQLLKFSHNVSPPRKMLPSSVN